MTADKILVVDDDRSIRWLLVDVLKEWGYLPIEAQSCQAALFVCESEAPVAVLLDIDLPDGSGLKALREIKNRQPEIVVIMITGNQLFENAVESLRGGAFDFISKPINLQELQVTLRNGLEARRLRKRIRALGHQQTRQFNFAQLVGSSPVMQRMVQLARKVAESEATAVLLQGESGTGKELVARAIHCGSQRAEGPFVPINCAAIPATLLENELFGHEKGAYTDAKGRKEGLFEQAEGGTLFLDEIGELEISLQAKLLRVLEEECFRRVGGLRDLPYDARIIAASNRDLKLETEAGRFRADLFYRLSVIQIELPPLRERGDDVLVLAEHFIAHFNRHLKKKITGLTPEVTELFRRYHWPGNVRELRNLIERVMILEDEQVITVNWLPREWATLGRRPDWQLAGSGGPSQLATSAVIQDEDVTRLFPLPPGGISLEAVERSLLRQAVSSTRGNQTKAAELLHITRDQLRYRLKKIEEKTELHGTADAQEVAPT
ncbi:MAG: sigma-54-dependent Fis family transcriptional regulator [Acidobacteria bacterium]|nr:sigma-54-dependent Fis family transcriptional regulator [Acidobacteriota bacterium]